MKTVLLAACCAAFASPGAATDAADPAAPVPRMTYRSVFPSAPAGVEPEALDWKKANAEVARFPRGHADLLKWEQAQPAAAPASAPAATPAHRH